MKTQRTTSLDTLEREREALRSRLAEAWELREPMENIRRIEEQMRTLWAQIEAVETHVQRE